MSSSVDDSLREQSKLLLRKLKNKQSKLQDILNTSTQDDHQSITVIKSPPSITYVKSRANTSQVRTPVRRFGRESREMNITEKMDKPLQKSVTEWSGKEARARLHKRRSKSKEEKENANVRNQKNKQIADKENMAATMKEKSIRSKVIDTDSHLPDLRLSEMQLSDIRREVEEQYLEELKCVGAEPKYRSEEPNEDANEEGIEERKYQFEEEDRESIASGGSATPNTARRRRIIDRNVRVNGPGDLNASALIRECEDDLRRLNFDYTEVDETDLNFLQSRLGTGTNQTSPDDTIPERDTPGTSYSSNLDNPGNCRSIAKFIRDTKKPKSILLSSSNTGRSNRSTSGNSSRVSFRSPTRDSSGSLSYQMDSYSKQQHKMLGYDWIAALMENDPAAVNQSETFFDELKEFRALNLQECSNSMYMDGPQELWEHPEREPEPVQRALEETKVKPYVVNGRLFAEPVQKSLYANYDYNDPGTSQAPEREPTYDEPRFVRVSIPRSTLETPSRVKAHRRNSFDAADSMSLSKHCMKGWNTNQPSTMPSSSNIALRDSTAGVKAAMKTTLDDAEKLAANYPYHWDPKEQSICRPLPRLSYRPEESYSNTTWPHTIDSNFTAYDNSSNNLQKATDDLLNSTYHLMYEMKRLKHERSDNPLRL